MVSNNSEKSLIAGAREPMKASPSSDLKKPRSNSSGSHSSASNHDSVVASKDRSPKADSKRLSPVALTIEWKEDLEGAEDTEEALRTSLHCFDDLYYGLTMMMTFQQTDLSSGKLVLNMQVRNSLHIMLWQYL